MNMIMIITMVMVMMATVVTASTTVDAAGVGADAGANGVTTMVKVGGDAGPRPGLCIGTSQGKCDIVYNGTVLPQWTANGWFGFQPGDIAWTIFYSIDPLLIGGTPRQQDFLAIANASDILYVYPPTDRGTIDASSFVETSHIEMICRSNGTAKMTMEIKMEPYERVDIHFNKTCVDPNINVGVPFTLGQPNVIFKGQINPGFRYVADVNEDVTTFGVWLPNDSPLKYQHFSVQTLHFDARYMAAAEFTSPSPSIAEPVTPTSTAASMRVTYNCHNRADNVATKMNITLNVGWDDKLVIVWTKICGPKPSSSSGWSGVGIFFFTMFILTLVFCLAGCTFNYVRNNRTGWEMMPGINLFRSCKKKVFGSKQYSPQDNYDDEAPTSTMPTANTYQTDL